MFEASVYPVILGWNIDYLGFEKRVHGTRVVGVAPRWKIAERFKNGQPIPFEIR
jgi:hypothetical protein